MLPPTGVSSPKPLAGPCSCGILPLASTQRWPSKKQTVKAVQRQVCLAFSGDGHLLAANDSDGDIHLWDTGTGQPTGRLRRPRGIFSTEGLRPRPYTVSGISLSPDGRLAAVLGQIGGYHGRCSVDLWDISTHPAAEPATYRNKRLQVLVAFRVLPR